MAALFRTDECLDTRENFQRNRKFTMIFLVFLSNIRIAFMHVQFYYSIEQKKTINSRFFSFFLNSDNKIRRRIKLMFTDLY